MRGEGRAADVKYRVAPTPPSGPALQTGLTGPCVGVVMVVMVVVVLMVVVVVVIGDQLVVVPS